MEIKASHDGYLKILFNSWKRNWVFSRTNDFVGTDKIIKKDNHNYKFDIRFHVEPNVKLMKTQNKKTILIELKDEGGNFLDNYDINIEMAYISVIKIHIPKIKIFLSVVFLISK